MSCVKSALPPRWIVREKSQADYGIDLEIEVADEFVTGLIVNAQVKGHQAITWNATYLTL